MGTQFKTKVRFKGQRCRHYKLFDCDGPCQSFLDLQYCQMFLFVHIHLPTYLRTYFNSQLYQWLKQRRCQPPWRLLQVNRLKKSQGSPYKKKLNLYKIFLSCSHRFLSLWLHSYLNMGGGMEYILWWPISYKAITFRVIGSVPLLSHRTINP